MGDTAMRLGSSMGPSLSGEKRCGTANTLWRMRRGGEAVEIFRDPLLRNGPRAVQRALPANWRATYVRADEQSAEERVFSAGPPIPLAALSGQSRKSLAPWRADDKRIELAPEHAGQGGSAPDEACQQATATASFPVDAPHGLGVSMPSRNG